MEAASLALVRDPYPFPFLSGIARYLTAAAPAGDKTEPTLQEILQEGASERREEQNSGRVKRRGDTSTLRAEAGQADECIRIETQSVNCVLM